MKLDEFDNAWIKHAPGAKLDYSIDWKKEISAGETISAVAWTCDSADIVLTQSQSVGTITSVVAAGGQPNKNYVLTCTVRTSSGLKDPATITLRCRP